MNQNPEFRPVGIVGGMGTRSTLFFANCLAKQWARCVEGDRNVDLAKIHMVSVYPTDHLTADTEDDVLARVQAAIHRLEALEVGYLVIPCHSAHVIADRLKFSGATRFLSIVDVGNRALALSIHQPTLLLGTARTANSRLYPDALGEFPLVRLNPDDQNLVDGVIARINKYAEQSEGLALERLCSKYRVSSVMLACTELSLIATELPANIHVVDPLAELSCSVAHLMVGCEPTKGTR